MSKVSGITPKEHRTRGTKAIGIGGILASSYRPYDRSCRNKKKYRFNTALNDASELWGNGDFLLVFTTVDSVGTFTSDIAQAQTAKLLKRWFAGNVVAGYALVELTNTGGGAR